MNEQYAEMKILREKRAKRLEDSGKLFRFLRESDEVGEWLNDQMAIAASEDYGRDVEHVEILIQKFESFLTALNVNEEKLVIIKEKAKVLIDEGHPEPSKIQEKVRMQWRARSPFICCWLLLLLFGILFRSFNGTAASFRTLPSFRFIFILELLCMKKKEMKWIYFKLFQVDELQQLWDDLKELSNARQEALAGAKQVCEMYHQAGMGCM